MKYYCLHYCSHVHSNHYVLPICHEISSSQLLQHLFRSFWQLIYVNLCISLRKTGRLMLVLYSFRKYICGCQLSVLLFFGVFSSFNIYLPKERPFFNKIVNVCPSYNFSRFSVDYRHFGKCFSPLPRCIVLTKLQNSYSQLPFSLTHEAFTWPRCFSIKCHCSSSIIAQQIL